MKPHVLIAPLTVILLFVAVPAYADGIRQRSSGGSLDVLVEDLWGDDSQARFKVSFLVPGTDTIQEHIDYDLVVRDNDGKELFRATKPLNQPTLHTAEGIVTIPYKFEQNGSYTVTIEMFGINFIPIATETAEFSYNVVPEFPASVLGVTAAVIAGVVAASRIKRR